MARIESVATALPPNELTQPEVRAFCEKAYAGEPKLLRLLRIFEHSGIEKRHFAFRPEYYLQERSFDERNKDYIEQGTALAERAARACLERAGVGAEEVDHLFLVTTTGLATPSLDALLAPRLGLRTDARRWPLFGLGCAGGAGGLVRADDVLRGSPEKRALVVSVELCGQIFSVRAKSPVDVVGASLFGDGAAAVLVSGGDVPVSGPRIIAAQTVLFSESQHVMGWNFTSDGMRLILSPDVVDVVKRRLRPVVESFLGGAGLAAGDIEFWILHPGGNRIIETYAETFGCNEKILRWTRRSLARVGNLSSASVLFTLTDVLENGGAHPGSRGLLVALGPGFGAEMILLSW